MDQRIVRGLSVVAPLAGALLNVGLNELNRLVGSPLFLDSIFTAVVAGLWGGVPGVATAVLTQLGMEMVLSFQGAQGTALPFVWCGIATALVVATMVHGKRFHTPLQLVVAIVLVTLANAVIGALTATFVFGGVTLHDSDFLVAGFLMGGQQLLDAAFWARLPLNLVDKGLAVGLAFALVKIRGIHVLTNP